MASAPASNAGTPLVTATDRSASPEQRPRESGFLRRHRRTAVSVLGAVVVAGFVYYVVPQIAGLGPTLHRLRSGNPWWLALGLVLEAMGRFLIRVIDECNLGRPHVVGPDVATSAALFAAAGHPERIATVILGSGGTAVPIQLGEPLRARPLGRWERCRRGRRCPTHPSASIRYRVSVMESPFGV
jgi:pimeloyl-ACP methyl ester carboxylesterase